MSSAEPAKFFEGGSINDFTAPKNAAPSAPVLVVEDNDDDLFFLRRALTKAAPSETVDVVSDGRAALDYLRDRAAASEQNDGRSLPKLIFLDLKLPYVLGLEVLASLRQNSALQRIPVVILTSSSEERDRNEAARLGAYDYHVKPMTVETLKAILAKVNPAPR